MLSQFSQLFKKLIEHVYAVPGTALDAGNIAVNKTDKKKKQKTLMYGRNI